MRYYHGEEIPRDFSGYCYIESTQEHQWRLNGKLHRLDGPAVIYTKNNTQIWYKHGELHRIGGPSITYCGDDTRLYHIEGKRMKYSDYINHHVNIKYKLDAILKLV